MLRPALSRRSIIAASAGLAAAAVGGNFFALSGAHAQADDGIPPAADAIQRLVPKPAPNLKFTDAAGRKLTLADFRGQGLVVNIWATWCPPCVAEFPTLAAIAPTLAASKILFLPISVDYEGLKAVQPFYRAHAIRNIPILLDPDGAITDQLGNQGIPNTLIIDPKFRLVGQTLGIANWNNPQTIRLLQRLAGPPENQGGFQPV
jgi:thiol-disulfide isomerase/thioredoxin